MQRSLSAVALFIVAVALAWVPSPAAAHVLAELGGGWGAGFAHPFSGLDHLLAMVAVGVWAAQIGRPALWLLPVAFPAAMALGGALGATGFDVPFVEAGIAGSVAVLGLLIAMAVRPPVHIAAALIVVFALCHGHAHGTELPETASPLLYGIGFVLATAILHAIGLGFGVLARYPFGLKAVRVGGGAIAVAGVALVAAL
jgi:urease accessory protein